MPVMHDPTIRERQIVLHTKTNIDKRRKSYTIHEYLHFEDGTQWTAKKRFAYKVYFYGDGAICAQLALEKSNGRDAEVIQKREDERGRVWRKIGSLFVQQNDQVFFIVYVHTVSFEKF